eukprot:5907305-Amphidinium_carterae.1
MDEVEDKMRDTVKFGQEFSCTRANGFILHDTITSTRNPINRTCICICVRKYTRICWCTPGPFHDLKHVVQYSIGTSQSSPCWNLDSNCKFQALKTSLFPVYFAASGCPKKEHAKEFEATLQESWQFVEEFALKDIRGSLSLVIIAQSQAQVQKYVESTLQQQLAFDQTVDLMPSMPGQLLLTYALSEAVFVSSMPSSNSGLPVTSGQVCIACASACGHARMPHSHCCVEGYIRLHASCTVSAKNKEGQSQTFPDPALPWTGRHNTKPLDPHWARVNDSQPHRVLLGGWRSSAEMVTMVFQGLLSPSNITHVDDAILHYFMDMTQPQVRQQHMLFLAFHCAPCLTVACLPSEVDFSHGRDGALLREGLM